MMQALSLSQVGKVKVGNHCIVGANAVVTKDMPDCATVAGFPARIVKHRSPDELSSQQARP